MICPNCQTANRDGAYFCKNCSQLLVDFCPNCGVSIQDDANFCDHCAFPLRVEVRRGWPSPAQIRSQPFSTHSSTTFTRQPAPVSHSVQPPATPAQPVTGESAQPISPLEQYIPQELMSKLEAARASGSMTGERRVVTMLFCDVKGSTAAAEQLDPEDWTEIINGAFEHMIKPVYKYEGTVARLMGDAILAFFGAPIAHEDDPQRAVFAGLDIVSGIEPYRSEVKLKWGLDFNVRVGINTGLVVVGAVGSDLRMEYTAMGDAINLASRMEQTAEPGTVQIAQDTYKLIKPLFDFEELGGIEVKGKEEPVLAYRVLHRKAEAGRMRGIEGLHSNMIGRDKELSRLQSVLDDLPQGIGRIISVIGRAGLGKSRLIQELKTTANGQRSATDLAQTVPAESSSLSVTPQWFEIGSLSYETTYPYALFQRLIRRLNNIAADATPEQFWQQTDELTEHDTDEQKRRVQQVFAALFGLPAPDGQPPLEGERFKQELFAVMAELWTTRFAARPTVMVLDDLHWADPASIDLLVHLLPAVETSPIVVLCAYRPDRHAPSWQIKQIADEVHYHRYTEINLRPLSESESDQMIDGLLSIADLPDELRVRIMERSGGNPFFVEEVVRTLIDHGAVVAEDRIEDGQTQRYWQATSDSAGLDIPDSLQGLLAARIDRLEEDTRQVVQLASVIGRSFYQRVLTEIGQEESLPAGEIDGQITRLVRLEMIQEASRLPELEYKFRNPLTQEIAYQTILHKRRRAFHLRVGRAMEALFPQQLAELAPRLAYHFAEAQDVEKSAQYFASAGDNAFRLFANKEAVVHYTEALAWAEKGDVDREQIIHIYRKRGRALELDLQYDLALENYQALESLGDEHGDDSLRLAGIGSQATLYFTSFQDLENAQKRSLEALELARKLGDRLAEAKSLWNLQLISSWTDPPQALAFGEQALAIARDLTSTPDASQESHDQLALILLDLTTPYLAAGKLDLALSASTEARQIFDNLGNLPMVSSAYARIGNAYMFAGRLQESIDVCERAVALDQEIGNLAGMNFGYMSMLNNYIFLGQFDDVFDTVELMKPIAKQVKEMWETLADLYVIMAYYSLGAYDLASEMAEPIIDFGDTGIQVWPQWFLTFAARALIHRGELVEAEALADFSRNGLDRENLVSPTSAHVAQFEAELALAKNDPEQAREILDNFLDSAISKGIAVWLPEKLLLMGRVQLALGDIENANQLLRAAYVEAGKQNARTVLWQICNLLATIEEQLGNETEANELQSEAREIVQFIADHAGRDELRATFLALPDVQAIMQSSVVETAP